MTAGNRQVWGCLYWNTPPAPSSQEAGCCLQGLVYCVLGSFLGIKWDVTAVEAEILLDVSFPPQPSINFHHGMSHIPTFLATASDF